MSSDDQPHKGSPGRDPLRGQLAGDPDDDTEPGPADLRYQILADRHAEAESPPSTGPAPVTDIEELGRLLIELGIIRQDELAALIAGIPPAEGALGLSRRLQKSGRLTAYQAAALHQGKSRGLQVGNYLILDRLGAGGMGVVFKARHRRLGRVVALKILPPSAARDRSFVQRFQREVEVAARLEHPHIVAALDASEDRGLHFLVMEYVEGRDLYRLVRTRGPLPIAMAIDFLIQAARGLNAAHSRGIVHRDIKPSNLIVDAAGTLRVLDLGLARLVDPSPTYARTACGPLTGTGIYMGSADYMAPEQAEDSRRADHRSDIYSLGCTLHFLVTGREPFTGDTLLKRLMAHQLQPPPILRDARPDAPQALEVAFQQMMAKRPDDRPESMAAVIGLLEPIRSVAAVAPPARLMVFEGGVPVQPAPAKLTQDSSIFAHLAGATNPLAGLAKEVDAVDPLAASPGGRHPSPTTPQPTRFEPVRRPVRLADRKPLCFDQGQLHELWREAQAGVQRRQGHPAASPRHVAVGPHRLRVVPSVRGGAAGQIAIQVLPEKQIDLLIPAVCHQGEPDRPLLAIWVYSDQSLVIVSVDLSGRDRYVVWQASRAYEFHFATAADLVHELFDLAMELPDQFDTVLSHWTKPV